MYYLFIHYDHVYKAHFIQVDWCWKRALELKESAKELTAPLFLSAALPDRYVITYYIRRGEGGIQVDHTF